MRLQRRRFLHLATAAAVAPGGVAHCRRAKLSRPAGARWSFPTRPAVRPMWSRVSLRRSFRSASGKQFFVENIGGGGGNIAMGRVAKMPPDGYTLLMVNPSYVVNPTLYTRAAVPIRKGLRSGFARGADDPGDRGPSVGAGADASRSLSRSSRPIPENTATRRRGPGRQGIWSAKSSACRSASTSCMCRSTARASRSVRRSGAIRRSASPRRRRRRSR